MIYLYDKSGKPVPVQESDIEAALAGGLRPRKGSINVYDPDGQLGSINSEQLLEAVQQGYRPESNEERAQRRAQASLGSLAGPAATAAAAARGATLGLSDIVLTGTGLVSKEKLRELEDAYPTISTAGEIVGAVAPAVLSGGSSVAGSLPAGMTSTAGSAVSKAVLKNLAAKGLQGTFARNTLARVASGAAGGAVEGALFGAGGAVSEYALGRTDELGEALVAHIGPAALLGGAIGSAGGLVSELAGTAMRKASDKLAGMRSLGPEIADSAVLEGIRSFSGVSRKQAAKLITRKGAASIDDYRGVLFSEGIVPTAAGMEPLLKAGLKSRELADRVITAGEHWGGVLGSLREAAETAGVKVEGAQLGARIAAAVEDVLPKIKMTRELEKAKTYYTRDLPRKIAKEGEINPVDLQSIKHQLDNQIRKMRLEHNDDMVSVLKTARREVSAVQDSVMKEALDAGQYQAYRSAMRVYRVLGDLTTLAKKGRLDEAAKTAFDRIKDYAVRRAAWQVASASMGGMGRIATTAGALFGLSSVAGGFVGDAGPAILRNRLANMQVLQKAQEVTESKILKAVQGFLKGTGRAAVPSATTIMKRLGGGYRPAHEVIQGWARDGETTATYLSANLSHLSQAAPESTRFAMDTVAKAREAALRAFPEGRPSLQPTLEPDPMPSDQNRIAQILAGSLDALGTIDDFGNLQLSYGQIKAFKENYPALARRLEEEVILAVADHDEKLSYEQAFQLSLLLGRPVEYGLSGAQIARYQMAHQQKFSPRPPTAKGVEFENLGKSHMGIAQRMEQPV